MKLEWIGHSCFRMTSQGGTVIMTDPYDDSVGIPLAPVSGDLVTMSHEHHDHNNAAMLLGAPVIARGLESARVGDVCTHALASYHDDVRGEKRGPNAIRVFQMDGLKVVHMGDQGCMPEADVVSGIAGADVMLLPVGGFYTVDARQAKAIVAASHPRCVVPMHYKTPHCVYPIEGVAQFLQAMGAQNVHARREAYFLPGDGQRGVVLMSPLALDERAQVRAYME